MNIKVESCKFCWLNVSNWLFTKHGTKCIKFRCCLYARLNTRHTECVLSISQGFGSNWCGWGNGQVAGCCEHGNEHSPFVEDGEYVDHVSDCRFLMIGWKLYVNFAPAFESHTDPQKSRVREVAGLSRRNRSNTAQFRPVYALPSIASLLGIEPVFLFCIRIATRVWSDAGRARTRDAVEIRRVRKTAKIDYLPRRVCLSVRPHRTAWLPLDGF